MAKVRLPGILATALCGLVIIVSFRTSRTETTVPTPSLRDTEVPPPALSALEPASAPELPPVASELPPFSLESLPEWARADPTAAGTWILSLPDTERLDAATKVLLALADHPGSALDLAQRLCREDPAFVREHGETLVVVLVETDRPDVALHFAELGGPERSAWLELALQIWARQDPARAAEAALAMDDGDGFAQVATEWAARDPAGLAGFFLQANAGPAGSTPVDIAFQVWRERRPSAFTAWIDRL